LGFWHFSQIAKWTKKDIAIVDDELSFKGRIERDDWVKQAKALAKGGEGRIRHGARPLGQHQGSDP
jgi:NADH-quinone oxidoreductase subunit E